MFKYELLGKNNIMGGITSLLKNRGVENVEEFLNPTEEVIENYMLFDHIEIAKDTYLQHCNNGSKIGLLVDCDVDGNTSSMIIYDYTKRVFPNIEIKIFIHDGKEHGLSKDVINDVLNSNIQFLIIPDAGTNDSKQCKILKDKGMDILILDHHIVTEENPYAIIVNNQSSKRVKDKSMTGVGVVYKFLCYIDYVLDLKYADDYLDVVALGMVADRADLHNLQSRYYVLKGIEQINNGTNKNKLITELFKEYSYQLNNVMTIDGLGFYIAPSINVIIRYGNKEEKLIQFEALCNSDIQKLTKIRGKGEVLLSLQEYIIRIAKHYKDIQKKETEKYVEILKNEIEEYSLNNHAIIVCKIEDDLSKTLTGLVANKLMSIYKRPCLLMREINGLCSGSARGYDYSNIKNFNQWCKDTGLFLSVDGHENAFGASIKLNKVCELYEIISQIEYDSTNTYYIDAILNYKNLSKDIILAIAKYDDIWGCGIDKPLFLIENIVINKINIKLIGKNQNTLKFNYHNIEFIKFNITPEEYSNIINCGENIEFSIIGEFEINEYQNNKIAQVMIKDMMYKKSDVVKSLFG